MLDNTIVVNNYNGKIKVFISNYNTSEGSDNWYELDYNGMEYWGREKYTWEMIGFESNGKRSGIYIKIPSVIQFVNINEIILNGEKVSLFSQNI